jgi:D-arabinose 5-phosphate isomerase GutQ
MSQIVRLFSRGLFAVIMYLILVGESRSGESGDLENAAEKAKRIQANAPGRSYQTNSHLKRRLTNAILVTSLPVCR